MRRDYLPPISIALMLLISAVAYAFLPDEMIVHWSFSLQPDGYATKAIAVLALPLIGLGLAAMQLIGRAIAHDGAAEVRFSPAIVFAMPILLIAHVALIIVGLTACSRG